MEELEVSWTTKLREEKFRMAWTSGPKFWRILLYPNKRQEARRTWNCKDGVTYETPNRADENVDTEDCQTQAPSGTCVCTLDDFLL